MSNSNSADEDELVLSVVRRLHAGDTPLHTLVRAATYMEVGKCAGKVRALLARDPGAAERANADGVTVADLVEDAREKVPDEIIAAVLDPGGGLSRDVAADAAVEVMHLINEVAPNLNANSNARASADADRGANSGANSNANDDANGRANANPPAAPPSATPAATAALIPPPSSAPNQPFAAWLTITHSAADDSPSSSAAAGDADAPPTLPGARCWCRLDPDAILWWAERPSVTTTTQAAAAASPPPHPAGRIEFAYVSRLIPKDSAASVSLVHHRLRKTTLSFPDALTARAWVITLRDAVFEAGMPAEFNIWTLSQAFDCLHDDRVDQGAFVDDLRAFFHREDITSASALARGSENLFESAVRLNKCLVVRELVVHRGADMASLSRRHGENALHTACRAGHVAMVGTLLALSPTATRRTASAFMAITNGRAETCAHMAAAGGHARVLEHLVTAGVDIYALDRRGRTALHACVIFDAKEEVTLGKLECLNFLCEMVPDILDWTDEAGATALHLASDCGAEKMVLTLLQTACDPNVLDKMGRTPLSVALNAQRMGCVQLLKLYGGMDAVALVASQTRNSLKNNSRNNGSIREGESAGGGVDDPLPGRHAQYGQPRQPQSQYYPNNSYSAQANWDWVRCFDEASGQPYWLDRVSGRSSWTAPPPAQLHNHDGSPKAPPRVGEVYRGGKTSPSAPPSHSNNHYTPPVGAGQPYSYYAQRKRDDAAGGGSSSMSESSSSDGEFFDSQQTVPAVAAKQPLSVANSSKVSPPPSLSIPPSVPMDLNATRPRRVSPGSLSLSPVDTDLANLQNRNKVAQALAEHSPLPQQAPPTPIGQQQHHHHQQQQQQRHQKSGLGRRTSEYSPSMSDRSPHSSGASSLGSPVPRNVAGGQPGATAKQRSPAARLAFALSPMGDPAQAARLVEERKMARAERRARQRIRSGDKKGGKR
jgi:ankyrin repeat protein